MGFLVTQDGFFCCNPIEPFIENLQFSLVDKFSQIGGGVRAGFLKTRQVVECFLLYFALLNFEQAALICQAFRLLYLHC